MALIFLEQEDITAIVTSQTLNQIIENDEALLEKAEQMAISEMTGYLNGRFEVAEIFNKTGGDRNNVIVMYLVDMLLYHLHARVSPRNISQHRVDRYNNALDYLRMATTGDIMPDLPLKTDEDGNHDNRIKYGSNAKRHTRF